MFNWLFGKSQAEKKPQPKETEKKWMYEALLQFLVSPEWKVTILNFVDNNCIVFDNEEENKFQYTTIHNKFKELVAGMFDSMMGQLGIDHILLLEFIEKGLASSNSAKVFEQLLYIDDFLKFKGMMIKRNAKLQREALQQMNGQPLGKSTLFKKAQDQVLYVKPEPFETNPTKSSQESQQEMIKRVMQMSLKEQEERKRQRDELEKREEDSLKNVMRQSKLQQDLELQKEQQKLATQRQQEEKEQRLRLLKEKKEKFEQERRIQSSKLMQEQRLQRLKEQQRKIQLPQSVKKQQPQLAFKEPEQVKKAQGELESIEQRKRRLLEQREILRKNKEMQRNQELERNDSKQQPQTILLNESGIHESAIVSKWQPPEEQKIPQSEVQRRRELMKRIKNKIVEDY